MKRFCLLLIIFLHVFAHAQSAQELLDSALVKKEQLKFTEGIQLCEQAIALDSTLTKAYFYKAGFHTALIQKQDARADYKHYKTAVANYTKVISKEPKNVKAYLFRGGAHDAMGFLDAAILDYKYAISINNNQPEAYNSLGVCYAKKGNIDMAVSYLQKAITVNPSYAKAYANIGNVYDMKQDIKNACKNWKQALLLGYTGNKRRYEAKCTKN